MVVLADDDDLPPRGLGLGDKSLDVPQITGRRGTSEELQKVADDVLREAYALGGQAVGGAPL